MPATYTTLESVKKILNANIKSRIRFPDKAVYDYDIFTLGATSSVQDMKSRVSNYDLVFDPSKVVFEDTYKGELNLCIYFDSPTSYIAYNLSDGDKKYRNVGSGSISLDFTPVIGEYIIEAGAFSGTIVERACMIVKVNCHIDTSTAEYFIEQAEIVIDTTIEGSGAKLRIGAPRMFLIPDVPPEIEVACAYLSAYLIYTAIFAEEQKDWEIKGSAFARHFVDSWKKRAESLMADYIAFTGRRPPVYLENADPSTFYGINLKFLEPNINASCGCNDNPRSY
jgi:hypothetical protein